MNAARAAAIPFILFVLVAPCALFAEEDGDENREGFQYPTIMSVAYDAESPHAGSVVILFEGIEGEDVRYGVYRAATPLTSARRGLCCLP